MEPLPKRFYYKHNRHQQLRGFYFAATLSSISKAAKHMGLSQPTVTMQVQSLERDLGVSLFEKRGGTLQLTDDGRTLLELAATHVEGLDNLYRAFFESKENKRTNKLRIGSGFMSAYCMVASTMRLFIDKYPEVEIHLESVSTEEERFELLRREKVDMLVGSYSTMPAEFEYIPVLISEPVLVTALDHPLARKKNVTLDDIMQYELILPPAYSTAMPVTNLFYEQYQQLNKHRRKIHLTLVNWTTIKKYVSLGIGVSIITQLAVEPTDKLAVIPMKKHLPCRTYGAVLRRNQYQTEEVQNFITLMKEEKRPGIKKFSATPSSPASRSKRRKENASALPA